MYISDSGRDPWKIHRFRFEVGKKIFRSEEGKGIGGKKGGGGKQTEGKGGGESHGDREN